MKLRAQLMRHEGVVPHAYQDHLGYWTIGAGRLIDARKGGGLSKAEIDLLLDNDIEKHRKELFARAPWISELDQVRGEALINMAFNLGVTGLLEFKKTLAAVRRGDYQEAAAMMLQSTWARQVGKRAVELSEQMRTGQYQI